MANTATSIYFAGSNSPALQYIQTDVNFASYYGDYTIEGWFYPTRADTREGIFSTAGTATADDLLLEFNSDNNIRFFTRDSSGNPMSSGIIDIAEESLGGKIRWQHLAAVRSGESISIESGRYK